MVHRYASPLTLKTIDPDTLQEKKLDNVFSILVDQLTKEPRISQQRVKSNVVALD